jgi:ABC-type transport system involved in cytochrome bd biosynthesis fused ATPase/permease subunit
VILHALALTARDIGIGLAACTVACLIIVVLLVIGRTLAKRADVRYWAEVERERQLLRSQLLDHERRRSEMRSYNARPTATERWGGLV